MREKKKKKKGMRRKVFPSKKKDWGECVFGVGGNAKGGRRGGEVGASEVLDTVF